jgi:uncharacterized membrane protein YkvA (DUF1232 family)
MAARLSSAVFRPWMLRTLWRDVRLALRLLREPRVPSWAKAALPVALLYVLSPVDVLPDMIPGIGQLDDLALLYAAVKVFLRLSPSSAVAFHQDALARRQPFATMPDADVVIDAEFRRDA